MHQRTFYELRIYHAKDPEQVSVLDDYLKSALLPALHNAGIGKVGVFESIHDHTDAGQKVFVLIPYQSVSQFEQLPERLEADKEFGAAAKQYFDLSYDNPAYDRFETILMKAFENAPDPNTIIPSFSRSEWVYELRSYESATEKYSKNKIDMFNREIISLFQKFGFQSVFFGEVLAGSRMPNLMYMTSFKDMNSRNTIWESWESNPEWKSLKARQEYLNNISRIDIYLLKGKKYADL